MFQGILFCFKCYIIKNVTNVNIRTETHFSFKEKKVICPLETASQAQRENSSHFLGLECVSRVEFALTQNIYELLYIGQKWSVSGIAYYR